MRSSILGTIIILLFSVSVSAQMKVPDKVLIAFKITFAGATDVKWDMENDSEFEAEFTRGGNEMSANFSANGALMESETELSADQLPEAIRKSIASEFVGFVIDEAESVEKPGKQISYEVEITKGGMTMEVLLAKDGKVIEKKMIDEQGDEEDID